MSTIETIEALVQAIACGDFAAVYVLADLIEESGYVHWGSQMAIVIRDSKTMSRRQWQVFMVWADDIARRQFRREQKQGDGSEAKAETQMRRRLSRFEARKRLIK